MIGNSIFNILSRLPLLHYFIEISLFYFKRLLMKHHYKGADSAGKTCSSAKYKFEESEKIPLISSNSFM